MHSEDALQILYDLLFYSSPFYQNSVQTSELIHLKLQTLCITDA